MQDPNADTEWNDILRSKGILPPKEEATIDEDTVVQVPILLFALFIFFQFTKLELVPIHSSDLIDPIW